MGVAATVGVSTLNGENNVKDWFISCSRQMVIELSMCRSVLTWEVGESAAAAAEKQSSSGWKCLANGMYH